MDNLELFNSNSSSFLCPIISWGPMKGDWMIENPLIQVREALQHIPGKYEDFFRSSMSLSQALRQTAVDLYKSLQILLQDWPSC